MQIDEVIKLAQEKVDSFNPEELKIAGLIPQNGAYFPSIYYPPITMYPASNDDEMFTNYGYNKKVPLSVYIHIPFCPGRCRYCHWVVSVGNSSEDMDYYLENLEKEMDIYRVRLGIGIIAPQSILIGGGTPSILSPGQTKRLLGSLRTKLDLTKCTQITCETEPSTILGSVGMEKLRIMKDLGVNRISLGVQSLDEKILKIMGRMHTSQEALEAIQQIKRVGFESLSIDLIYGYPGSTVKKWIESLHTVFSLDVDACQQYRLRIAPHGDNAGIIKGQFEYSPGDFPSLKEIYLMKEAGILFSSLNGFVETSRRVFCKTPEDNSDYLINMTDKLYDVMGIGISAWANIQGHLTINTGESLEKYYAYIKKGKLPIDRGKVRTEDDEKRWAIVMPLKHHGVSKDQYRRITGITLNEAFGEKIKRLKNYGLLEENGQMLILTEKGRFFADEVVFQFHHPEYIPFKRSAYTQGELTPHNT